MASVIGDFVCGTRNFLAQGFRSLPVILASAVLILGLTQANFNLLFFFVGMFILSPLTALITNALCEFLFAKGPVWLQPLWAVPNGAAMACQIFTIGPSQPLGTPVNVVPSYWLTMMAFFFAYLILNAWNLYTLQANSKAPEAAVNARKSQAIMSIAIIGVLAVATFLLRYMSTGCETGFGVGLSAILGGGIAWGWYTFMRNCGLGRLDDLFGISSRILPMQSYEDVAPTVCVPTSDNSV